MRFLRKKQVAAMVALSPTQIGRLEAVKKFPLRGHIGFRVVWDEDEVIAWMKARLDERPTDPPSQEDKSTE